jgi:hypothetical protein
MDCEQILSLSESLLMKDGQTVIEASMKNVGVAQTSVILRQSLRTKLHKKELTKEQVRAAFVKAGLDPILVDELLVQK